MCYLSSLFETVPCTINASIHKSIHNEVVKVVVIDDAQGDEVISEADKFGLREKGH